MAEIKLKSCPFCGEEVELYSDCDDATSTWIYWIACGECDCRQPKSIHKQAVINGWNTRKGIKKKKIRRCLYFMHNLNKLLKKLKKYGISLNIKYYDSIDCFAFRFEKIDKSWAFQISERDLASDLCIKSLENELDKLIESGYFNQP